VSKLICSNKYWLFKIKYGQQPKLMAFHAVGMVENRINGSKPSMGSTFIRRISKEVWVAQVTSRGGAFWMSKALPTKENVV